MTKILFALLLITSSGYGQTEDAMYWFAKSDTAIKLAHSYNLRGMPDSALAYIRLSKFYASNGEKIGYELWEDGVHKLKDVKMALELKMFLELILDKPTDEDSALYKTVIYELSKPNPYNSYVIREAPKHDTGYWNDHGFTSDSNCFNARLSFPVPDTSRKIKYQIGDSVFSTEITHQIWFGDEFTTILPGGGYIPHLHYPVRHSKRWKRRQARRREKLYNQ